MSRIKLQIDKLALGLLYIHKWNTILQKHAVKKTWPEKIEDLRITQKSIDKWYRTVELTSKRWKTCDAQNCSGNKEDAKQIFCASCRKWYHETCLPDDQNFFASSYYCCEK